MAAISDVPSAARTEGVHVWKGLLWREWLAHRNLVVNALAVWLVCGWVLLIFSHPGFIIAFGVLYAFLAGALFGGGDAAEGSEEFSFALPPTRQERYVARLLLGGATVLGFTVLGNLAIALDLPQKLWGLVVNSGFTEPFPPCEPRFIYALAIALPIAVFACAFALATHARSPGLVWMSWLLSGLVVGILLGVGLWVEHLLWQEFNGYVSTTALLAAAPLALLAGSIAYQRKEGISRPAPMRGRSAWWVWALIAVFIVLAFMFLMLVSYRAVRERSHAEMRRAETAHEMELHRAEEAQRRKEAEPPRPKPATSTTSPAPDRGE
jgi:hypothetical protein